MGARCRARLITGSCCSGRRFSAIIAFAPPGPRSFATVVSKFGRNTSNTSMIGKGRGESRLLQGYLSSRLNARINNSPPPSRDSAVADRADRCSSGSRDENATDHGGWTKRFKLRLQDSVYTTNAGDLSRRFCTSWYRNTSRPSLPKSSTRPGRTYPILSKMSSRPFSNAASWPMVFCVFVVQTAPTRSSWPSPVVWLLSSANGRGLLTPPRSPFVHRRVCRRQRPGNSIR